MGGAPRPTEGFSLIEVIIAVGMLASALIVLGQLSSLGRKQIDEAIDSAVATRLASNKMARLATGIDPVERQEAEPLWEDPAWECRIEVWPAEQAGLAEVAVSVRRIPPERLDEQKNTAPWFTLSQWLLNESDDALSGQRAPPIRSGRSLNPLRANRSR